MIPINRENVRDVIIVVCCIAAAYGLFYLAGCGKPARAQNLPTKVVNGIDHPLTEPQPIYGGKVEPSNTLPPLQGGTGTLNHPLPAKDLGIIVDEGDGVAESNPPAKGLQAMAEHPPQCLNKTRALAVLISDPGIPDVWRGAYLCNAREIVPARVSGWWRYVDQKRYGYWEWKQK